LTAILLWPILVAILADIYSQTSLVTCILVNWNGYRETIACLEALKATSYCVLNIVVVDNASNDDSVDRIRSAHSTVKFLSWDWSLCPGAGFCGGVE
jgi:hypothetical protein